MRVDVLHSLQGVSGDEWDPLAQQIGFYASSSWLRGVERDTRFPVRYLVAQDHNQLLGAALLYAASGETNSGYRPPRLPVTSELDVVIGPRRGYRSGVLLRADLEDGERDCVLTDLARGLRHELGDAAAGAFCYVPQEVSEETARLVPGWGGKVVAQEAWLHGGEGFDSFAHALPGKKRRMLATERRRFLSVGYDTELVELTEVQDEIWPLLRSLEAKHGVDRGAEHYSGLIGALAAADNPGMVVTCRAGQRLVGFVHFYVFAKTLWARTTGFDYARLSASFEYFNIVMYELLELAPRLGCESVHLGMGSIEAKRNHGADVRPLFVLAPMEILRDPQ